MAEPKTDHQRIDFGKVILQEDGTLTAPDGGPVNARQHLCKNEFGTRCRLRAECDSTWVSCTFAGGTGEFDLGPYERTTLVVYLTTIGLIEGKNSGAIVIRRRTNKGIHQSMAVVVEVVKPVPVALEQHDTSLPEQIPAPDLVGASPGATQSGSKLQMDSERGGTGSASVCAGPHGQKSAHPAPGTTAPNGGDKALSHDEKKVLSWKAVLGRICGVVGLALLFALGVVVGHGIRGSRGPAFPKDYRMQARFAPGTIVYVWASDGKSTRRIVVDIAETVPFKAVDIRQQRGMYYVGIEPE